MNRYPLTSIIFCLFLLVIHQTADILTVLPKAVAKKHSFPEEKYQVRQKEHFQYRFGMSESVKFLEIDKDGVPTEPSCKFKQKQIEIEEVRSFSFSSVSLEQDYFINTAVAVSTQERLVYFLKSNMKIVAFHFNQTHLTKAQEYSLNVQNTTQYTQGFGSALIASGDGQYVFLFSPYGIWKIECKGILSVVEKLSLNFTSSVNEVVLMEDHIAVATENNGLFIYKVSFSGGLLLVNHYTRVNSVASPLKPVSLATWKSEGILYVLDDVANIYVYRLSRQRLIFYDTITTGHEKNGLIRAENEHLIYSFKDEENFKIAELVYTPNARQAQLVRYFKLFDFIDQIFLEGNSMYVFSSDVLDWFPLGVDPRIIQKEHNGVRIHSTYKRVIQIWPELFLLSDYNKIEMAWVRLITDGVECNFQSNHPQIQLKITSNISSCAGNDGITAETSTIFPGKFNEYCSIDRTITFNIEIPEIQQRQTIMIYGIAALFIVIFILGTFCLIQWRNGRIELIDKINAGIRRLQDKNKMEHRKLVEQDIKEDIDDRKQDRKEEIKENIKEDVREERDVIPPTEQAIQMKQLHKD